MAAVQERTQPFPSRADVVRWCDALAGPTGPQRGHRRGRVQAGASRPALWSGAERRPGRGSACACGRRDRGEDPVFGLPSTGRRCARGERSRSPCCMSGPDGSASRATCCAPPRRNCRSRCRSAVWQSRWRAGSTSPWTAGPARSPVDLEAAAWPREPDGFVDRAIQAYLRGRTDEAAVHMGIWADRGAPAESFGLPGLDEIGPIGAPSSPEPPEATAARTLRRRIRSAREASWRSDLRAAAEQSREIRSPFERARVEALLGSCCAIRNDHAAGVRHLRAARSLFDESGALAWRAWWTGGCVGSGRRCARHRPR